MTRLKKTIALTLVLSSLFAVAVAAQLDTLIKGAGIAYVISKFGPDINKAINAATKTPNDNPTFATKVVPVISVGDGKQAGAVQIMGPRAAVNKVQAVAQFETKFKALGMRLRGLVPIDSKNIKEIRRVPGVGISGLLDVKI
ncbi:MAG: hypothetical protein H7308_08850 [Chthonomonadaceae bacterium]|nr:hypothetical protein [Chthonomonadaceae bacterium]